MFFYLQKQEAGKPVPDPPSSCSQGKAFHAPVYVQVWAYQCAVRLLAESGEIAERLFWQTVQLMRSSPHR